MSRYNDINIYEVQGRVGKKYPLRLPQSDESGTAQLMLRVITTKEVGEQQFKTWHTVVVTGSEAEMADKKVFVGDTIRASGEFEAFVSGEGAQRRSYPRCQATKLELVRMRAVDPRTQSTQEWDQDYDRAQHKYIAGKRR